MFYRLKAHVFDGHQKQTLRLKKYEWRLVCEGVEAFKAWRYTNGRLVFHIDVRREFEKQISKMKLPNANPLLGAVLRQELALARRRDQELRLNENRKKKELGQFYEAWARTRKLEEEIKRL